MFESNIFASYFQGNMFVLFSKQNFHFCMHINGKKYVSQVCNMIIQVYLTEKQFGAPYQNGFMTKCRTDEYLGEQFWSTDILSQGVSLQPPKHILTIDTFT